MTEAVQSRLRVRRRTSAVRRVRGWSEGDVWTVGIGLVVALALATSTIPAVLDARNAPRAAAPATAAAPAASVPGPGGPVVTAPPGAPRVSQPLLGPLAPVAPLGASVPAAGEPDAAPPPGPTSTSSAAAAPPPGAVRLFASRIGGAPGAIVTAPDGTVSAGTDAPEAGAPAAARLVTWDVRGALRGSSEVPQQPATRSRGLTGLGYLPDGALVAVDASTARVLRYDARKEHWSVLTRLPDLVTCVLPTATPCQPGLQDTPPLPRGVAVDRAGVIFIADAGQGTVWRLRPGRPIEVWYQSADLAGNEGLAGLAFDLDGHLLAAVTRLAGLTGSGAGALIRIERAADGTAGARSLVTAFRAGEDPVDVAVGASGSLYVPLRGADAVVILDRRGVESLRVVDDALKAPTAVDLTAGRALVTAAGPPALVLQIGIADRPAAPRR